MIGVLSHKSLIICGERENNGINDKEITVNPIFKCFPTILLRGLGFSTVFPIFTVVKMFRKRYAIDYPIHAVKKTIILELETEIPCVRG